ncbi:MAG: exodeoxyribonuclease VII small subunit [Coriobacteriaceae bacterium]|nr:exodeoxyribonuclease VII small subunit [Coriobacteriaceae bacterium]
MNANECTTFSEARARLDEIASEVRKKDLSLEKSLDLYEEAIQLGNRCAELVDKPDFTPEEAEAAAEALEEETPDASLTGEAESQEATVSDEEEALAAEAEEEGSTPQDEAAEETDDSDAAED